jgi:hypothetical protein
MRIRRALEAVDDESASSIAFEPSYESQNLRPNVETSSYPNIKRHCLHELQMEV